MTSGKKRSAREPWLVALLVLALSTSGSMANNPDAEDAEEKVPEPSVTESRLKPESENPTEGLFHRLRVVSTAPEKTPGSVHVIGREELRRQDYSDANRVLRMVPGVNVQEEDGYGLRPNIGMRGTGVERSQKITLLEDGVLIAPAPYSAPSAYYFPSVARMEGVEVRKGSSSIRQGPYTNGGALEFTSSSIPSGRAGHLNLAVGGDATRRGHVWYGGSSERFGWLAETFQMRTDGFKELDGGGTTGFDLEDYMVKFRYNSAPGASVFQALELKLGRTDQLAQETYLGLTDADFAAAPYRRYAASQQDQIRSEHRQAQLRHFIKPSTSVDLTTTVYRNDFFRNWYKLDKVGGAGIAEVLETPGQFVGELAILRGDANSAPDALKLRNNRRDYYSQGIQTVLGWHPGAKAENHDFEIGVRLHEDAEDRFQEDDGFRMTAGTMVQTSSGAPGSQSNRISSARALAVFVQDTIHLDRWTLTPGLRLESIDMQRRDFGKNDATRLGSQLTVDNNDTDVLLPGFGFHYRLDGSSGLFGGIHRGFGPPGPGSDEATRPEESLNYEFGYRRNNLPWQTEIVGFYNDYDNLLGRDTVSSGGTGSGDAFNGGQAMVYGLESSFETDIGRRFDLPLGLPISMTYTFTHAEFDNSFDSSFAGWGDRVHEGDHLPYLPEHQLSLRVGVTSARVSAFVNLAQTSEARTLPGQGPILDSQRIDGHFLVDLTANLVLPSKLRLFVQVRNLTDEVYMAARRPAGIRPGIGRTTLFGVGWDF